MRRHLALLLLVAACDEPPPTEPSIAPPGDDFPPAPRILVTNSLSSTMSSLDPATGEMTVHARTLGTWANRVTAVPDGRTLLVTASGDNEIQLLGAHDLAVLGGIDVGPGSNPWIAVPIDAGSAIVSNWVSGDVRRLDLARGTAGPPLATVRGPEGIAVAAGRAWVACTNYRSSDGSFGEGRVDVVDLSAWTVVASIPVAVNPQDLAIAADGRVHVVCTGTNGAGAAPVEGEVQVIDPGSLRVVGRVDLGGAPGRIALDEEGTAWIAGYSGGVRRYDATTLALRPDPVDPALRSSGLSAIAVDEAEDRVYVTSFDLDLVLAVDRAEFAVQDAFLVGDGPVDVLVFRP